MGYASAFWWMVLFDTTTLIFLMIISSDSNAIKYDADTGIALCSSDGVLFNYYIILYDDVDNIINVYP